MYVETVRITTVVRKAINTTYSGCVYVALVIRHAMCMRHNVICDLPGSAAFSTLPHKWHDFPETVVEHNMYVVIFFTTLV